MKKYMHFFNTTWIVNLAKICDGDTSVKADRYINFTKGFDSGSIYIVTVHPN